MARRSQNYLKAQKQRRQGRRAYLTSTYSLIRVPRSISTTGIPEDAQALFAYRKRGTTTGCDPFLDAIFPGIKQESIERKFALERSEEEKLLDLIQSPDVCDYITMGLESLKLHTRVTFVFNRKYSQCYFIEVHYGETGNSYCMKSKVYGGRDRAMFDFNHGRITWMEFLPLSSLSLVLPRRG